MSRFGGCVVVLASLTFSVGCTPVGNQLHTEEPHAKASAQNTAADALSDVKLASRNARLLGLDRLTFDAEGANRAHITWRIPGFDSGVSDADVSVIRREDGNRPEIAELGPGGGVMPLWLTEQVEVRRAPGVVVFGAGERVDRVLKDAKVARRNVLGIFPEWDGKLVVEVPSSQVALAASLAGQPGAVEGVAAVTSSSDGSRRRDTPIHVFVNATVYESMAPSAARIVMTHEVVHVATKAPTVQVPLWWAEGLADYLAFSEVDRRDASAARQLIRQSQQQLATYVATHGEPDGLPRDSDFGGAGRLAAYEAARTACQVLVESPRVAGEGTKALVELQRHLAEGVSEKRAIPRVFGISYREFIDELQRSLTRDG